MSNQKFVWVCKNCSMIDYLETRKNKFYCRPCSYKIKKERQKKRYVRKSELSKISLVTYFLKTRINSKFSISEIMSFTNCTHSPTLSTYMVTARKNLNISISYSRTSEYYTVRQIQSSETPTNNNN